MKVNRLGISCCFVTFAIIGSAFRIGVADEPVKKSLADELPRIAATEPQDVSKTFAVQHGFRLELAAHEPDVADPVDACFDENGRLYVAEMHGYPFSHEPTRLNPGGGGKYNAGVIRLLEDTNGDGRFDRSVRFADDITWPTSVCCFRGGVFVLAPPNIHYFKDTNGDDIADVHRIVYTGFGRDNVQSLANNMKWTLDNRIALAAGRNPGVLKHKGKTLFSLGRSDVSFDPKTEQAEQITGGVQFGHSLDDWGNRFVCSNSNHIQHIVFERKYINRNPHYAPSGVIRSIAAGGAAAPVFRRSPAEPWRIVRQKSRAKAKGYKLVLNKDGKWEFLPLDPSKKKGVVPTEYPIGYFTSATGVTIYRGDAYTRPFRGNAFIGDVGGNLVHRKTLTPNGVSFVAKRADQNTEFIVSTDNWFRPVNFVNGPDGMLYILDMYRETIEHPYSIPGDIKKYLDLQSGNDRGRIYRLVPRNSKRKPFAKLGDMSVTELVSQLESSNSWNRQTAQRLLWEEHDKTAVTPLVRLFKQSEIPLARLHALSTLRGLDALSDEVLIKALFDKHPGVREHALRLAEDRMADSQDVQSAVAGLAHDKLVRVRFQAALTMGASSEQSVTEVLKLLAIRSSNESDVRAAVMTSVRGRADKILSALFEHATFSQQSDSVNWLTDLAGIVGTENDHNAVIRVLSSIAARKDNVILQSRILGALASSLGRKRNSLQAVLSRDSVAAASVKRELKQLFDQAINIAGDRNRTQSDRTAAVALLAYSDSSKVIDELSSLLSPQTPQAVQLAAVDSLSRHQNDRVPEVLLVGWSGHTPRVRRGIVDNLVQTTPRVKKLFDAVTKGHIQRSEIERDKKQLLMNHPNKEIRNLARVVFKAEVGGDRAKVVAAYQKVLELDGDSARGKELFTKKCSICHRVGKIGHQVAPDLASVQNKSVADLIIAILDPNREAQPNFTNYTVVTEEGRIVTGIIAAETATTITLRRAEAKEDVILRGSIEDFVSSGKSLMPEGFEKDISPEQLADVIEFVKSIRATASE